MTARLTLEQRLQQMLGERDLAIADLLTKLEAAQEKIAEFEQGKEVMAARERMEKPILKSKNGGLQPVA